MTSPNNNCNTRDSDEEPLKKKLKQDYNYSVKSNSSDRWNLSGQNGLELLAEMGLGMLDDVSEFNKSEDESSCLEPASSSTKTTFEQNDTNPDLIIPGNYYNTSFSNECVDNSNKTSREQIDPRNELSKQSKTWESFCIYKRQSLMTPDAKDWFNFLSDEIILLIFKWLPKLSLSRCALVCKRWHRLASDETLWTRLDCSTKVLDRGALGHILSRQVLILKLTQAEILDPPILPNVKAYNDDFVAKLMYLDLGMVTASTQCLEKIFEKCTRLRKVSLESCQINERVCYHLSKNKFLEVLNLTMAEGLNSQGIKYIAHSFKQLRELNVAWTNLSIEALNFLCDGLPKSLSRLNLSGCRKTLNVRHVKLLVQSCPNLRELDLSDGTSLTNDTIKYLITLKDLNFLALSRCYGIQYELLKKLSYMASLQYLDIHGGHIEQSEIDVLQSVMGNKVQLNKFMFTSIARPTVGLRRSSIWGLRVRD